MIDLVNFVNAEVYNMIMYYLFSLSIFWVFFAIFLIFSLILVFKMAILVNQAEVVIIERLGKFHMILHPGLHFIVPFIDAPRQYYWTMIKLDPISRRPYRYNIISDRLDLREAVYDFPRQNVITKDNVTMEINALLYYQITDPMRALYEIQDLPESIEKLTQTKLREVIGSLDLDETFVSRDFVNERLRETLDGATDKWGVKVNRVELQEITPPQDMKIAMEKQMRAERDRRAIVLEAEGEKQAAILKAEGERSAKVTRAMGDAESKTVLATGEAQAKLTIAEGEANALRALAAAVPNFDPAQYNLALSYIKALSEITSGKDNKTIIMPYEITSVLGSISTIKELFISEKNPSISNKTGKKE